MRLRAGAQRSSPIARGRGVVTRRRPACSSRATARSATHDHAELLWQLLDARRRRASCGVYCRPERLSLWGFLKEHAAPALAAGAALLVLWLWRIAPRFGPVAPDAPPARRRLLDHLRASGRYYWAKGLRARLVVAARDAALRRIARAQPDFAGAPQPSALPRLASLPGFRQEEAARFLGAAGAMRGADFIKLTQHAQRVHSALEKGTK